MAASAAPGPCPRPSATRIRVLSGNQATAHRSPQTTSPGLGNDSAPTSKGDGRVLDKGFDQSLANNAVPAPGTEWISNKVARRSIAPRPVPGLPVVEYPSRIARAALAIPGPLSSASTRQRAGDRQ